MQVVPDETVVVNGTRYPMHGTMDDIENIKGLTNEQRFWVAKLTVSLGARNVSISTNSNGNLALNFTCSGGDTGCVSGGRAINAAFGGTETFAGGEDTDAAQNADTTQGSSDRQQDHNGEPRHLVVKDYEKHKYNTDFYYQLTDGEHNLTKDGYSLVEHIDTLKGDHGVTSEGKEVEMDHGVADDQVGMTARPQEEESKDYVRDQTFTVYFKGDPNPYELTTKFEHETKIVNGEVVLNNTTVLIP
jgi:hypothetical protein